ncbi:MurR/RpiR family transcriptional regulator [Enterococcus diestrammenae]|uniref:MurR/RpiR family transcriptional regulator n=1 Tax=Enterococcus diestrammenae TaxID=1155073 RepID=UPI00195CBDA6
MDILKLIEQKFNYLAPKERSIGMFILENPDKTQSMTINQLASETNTSIGSITRFCKKMECKNYADLKIKLAMTTAYLNNEKMYDKEIHNTLDEVSSYYKEVIENNIRSINETDILKLIKLINQSDHIYIFGLGSSALTATELKTRLMRMGLNVHTCIEPDTMRITTSLLNPNDLVIAISNSGESKDIVNAVIAAKEKKASVVSFTSFIDSPLTRNSDFFLLVYNSLFLNKENFINSQFSLMYLIDVISIYLLQNQSYALSMKKTINAVLEKNEINR